MADVLDVTHIDRCESAQELEPPLSHRSAPIPLMTWLLSKALLRTWQSGAEFILLLELLFLRCGDSLEALQLYRPLLLREKGSDPFDDKASLGSSEFFPLVFKVGRKLAEVIVSRQHPPHQLDIKSHHLYAA